MTEESDESEARLVRLEERLEALRRWLESSLAGLAEEMRRAEARDEWAVAQLRETRKTIRRQNETLEHIRRRIADEPVQACRLEE